MKWTQKTVERKLQSVSGLDSFLSGVGRGYLFLEFGRTRVAVFREDIGVSYYYLYPILDISEAVNVNEFMRIAIPYLSNKLEENRKAVLLYKP